MELKYVVPNVTNPRELEIYFRGLKDAGVIRNYRGRAQPRDNGSTLIGDIHVVLDLLDETKREQIDKALQRYNATPEPAPTS